MGMMLNERTLKKMVNEVANEVWGVNCQLPITISGRMTRALGQYRYTRNRFAGKITPLELRFSKYLVNGSYNEETIKSVIKHELAHWKISLETMNFHDGDYPFENELRRIGAHSTGIIKTAGELYHVVCSKCGKTVVTKPTESAAKRYAQPKYSSRCCHAPLKYAGLKIIEDKNVTPIPKDEKLRQVATKTAAPSNVIKIEDIIEGKKMNKTIMLNALRNALEEKSQVKVDLLKQHYPEVFEGTLRYVPQKLKSAMGL